jgi:hypothetical protein
MCISVVLHCCSKEKNQQPWPHAETQSALHRLGTDVFQDGPSDELDQGAEVKYRRHCLPLLGVS